VARDAATELAPHLAEGQVDLVVDGDDVIEGDAQLASRGARGVPGVIHEGLGQEDRDAGASRTGATVRDQAAEALAALRQLPAAGELIGDLETEVVPGAGVLASRIPETDDQCVGPRVTRLPRAAAKQGQRLLPAV
jgi:hypothetical protein